MGGIIPYETTLIMQSYVQMRDQTNLDFLDVFTASTQLERELGWDMQIRNLKEALLGRGLLMEHSLAVLQLQYGPQLRTNTGKDPCGTAFPRSRSDCASSINNLRHKSVIKRFSEPHV